jgi:hypothetical protein
VGKERGRKKNFGVLASVDLSFIPSVLLSGSKLRNEVIEHVASQAYSRSPVEGGSRSFEESAHPSSVERGASSEG